MSGHMGGHEHETKQKTSQPSAQTEKVSVQLGAACEVRKEGRQIRGLKEIK